VRPPEDVLKIDYSESTRSSVLEKLLSLRTMTIHGARLIVVSAQELYEAYTKRIKEDPFVLITESSKDAFFAHTNNGNRKLSVSALEKLPNPGAESLPIS